MRITGGLARGIPLNLPKGDAVRPATDAMRQAVFSSLAARVADARFLDLFAGSGAYGLEAFSRGAAGGVFVEKDARTCGFIRQNIAAVAKSVGRAAEAMQVVSADASRVLPGEVPDLVFIDPPYDLIAETGPALLGRLHAFLAPKPDALVVFEMPGELAVTAPGWTCVKQLGKGARQPTVRIFKADPVSPAPA